MPLKSAIRAKGGKRVEPNLPDIALRICKMAMIPAPKRVSGRLQNGGSCGTSTGQHATTATTRAATIRAWRIGARRLQGATSIKGCTGGGDGAA